jgi:hypothetical protein
MYGHPHIYDAINPGRLGCGAGTMSVQYVQSEVSKRKTWLLSSLQVFPPSTWQAPLLPL